MATGTPGGWPPPTAQAPSAHTLTLIASFGFAASCGGAKATSAVAPASAAAGAGPPRSAAAAELTAADALASGIAGASAREAPQPIPGLGTMADNGDVKRGRKVACG